MSASVLLVAIGSFKQCSTLVVWAHRTFVRVPLLAIGDFPIRRGLARVVSALPIFAGTSVRRRLFSFDLPRRAASCPCRLRLCGAGRPVLLYPDCLPVLAAGLCWCLNRARIRCDLLVLDRPCR